MTHLLMAHTWCLVPVSENYEYVRALFFLCYIRNNFFTYLCLFNTKLGIFLFWKIMRMADQTNPSLHVQVQKKRFKVEQVNDDNQPYLSVICYASVVQWLRRRGIMFITTAQLYSTKPEFSFCAGSNRARGVLEICDGEDLWQWSRLEIKLNTFRRSIIPEKQFIKNNLCRTFLNLS